MPTYVYRRADGTTFERFQKMSDAPLTEDPETGAPVSRVISGGAGLQFKGDGFYLTDYVHTGQKDRTAGESKAEGTSSAKSESKAPAKADSKPAATPAAPSSSDD